MLVNFAYMFIFCLYAKKNHYMQKNQKLRSFYGIKIYVIENKIQPPENDPQNHFFKFT